MGNNGNQHAQWVQTALQTYEVRLLRYAQRIIGDASRAEDVVQETFLRLCKQNADELNGRLPQWLYTVCRNRALDIKRKESRMTPMVEAEVALPSQQTKPPSHDAEVADENTRVLAELSQLKETQQECLRLKFHDGLTYREIGEILDLSTSNVGFLIHTGLKTLRERLSD